MAFFGLTALGSQNAFSSSSRTALNLHVFNENEFVASWRRVVGSRKTCDQNELQSIFRTLFHGPIPPYDAEVLSESFNGGIDEQSFDDYLETMNSLKEWAELKESNVRGDKSENCDITTSTEFQESMTRHRRTQRGPREKQLVPITTSQEVSALFW
jgi:hypothetical protein